MLWLLSALLHVALLLAMMVAQRHSGAAGPSPIQVLLAPLPALPGQSPNREPRGTGLAPPSPEALSQPVSIPDFLPFPPEPVVASATGRETAAASPGTPSRDPDPTAESAPVEAGGNVSGPVVIESTRVLPDYTQDALDAHIEGQVILRAVIDEKGKVTHAEVLRGLAYGLDEAALAAVRRWRFRPAQRGGRPVKVFYILTVNFQI